MNVRYGRILALCALVGTTVPTAAGAAGGGGPILGTPAASTPQRIIAADQAPADQYWSTRGAAEVLISDTDTPPAADSAPAETAATVPSAVPSIGWRRPRQASGENKIRFTEASSATSTTTPTAIPATSQSATAPGIEVGNTADFELQLRAAALASKMVAEEKAAEAARAAAMADTPNAGPVAVVKPLPATNTTAAAAPAVAPAASITPTTVAIEPQVLQDANIQLAMTKFQDVNVKAADGEESIPAPEDPYANGKPLRGGMDESYECLDGACCPPPRPLFWTAGVDATFLSPDLNSQGTEISIAEFEYDRLDTATSFDDNIDSVYLAPRIWIGVQGCLWGANLRYWHLHAGEASYDPALGSNGQWDGPDCGVPDLGYNSQNQLDAYTIDLEITRRLCIHDCWMQFSAGVRHAEIWQDESISATGITDDSMMFAFAQANRNTRGTGLVFGWYGRKPIYPCSCVHWFYNFRWAAMWGPTQTAAETGVLVGAVTPDAVAAAGSVNGASTYVDDNLFVGEVQLGLEWDYALRCVPANAFFRTAVEYQRWTGGQGYSAADSFAGVAIDDGVNPVEQVALGTAFAAADAPVMELIGLSIGTGLTW